MRIRTIEIVVTVEQDCDVKVGDSVTGVSIQRTGRMGSQWCRTLGHVTKVVAFHEFKPEGGR